MPAYSLGMSNVTITLPDGSSKSYPAGTTGYDIARSISPRLAKEAIAVKVDAAWSRVATLPSWK